MSELMKRTLHDCQPPTPADQGAEHKWTCDDCGQEWAWSALYTYREQERYGFLGFRTRTMVWSYGGQWGISGQAFKRDRWEPTP